jgi:tRNA U34 5-carboxymethylaminomethyl modifying enzyme MnmG/GidA
VNFSSESGYQVATGPEGQSSHAHLFAAGSCTGTTSLAEAVRQGERAGLACSLSLKDDPAVAKRLKALMPA